MTNPAAARRTSALAVARIMTAVALWSVVTPWWSFPWRALADPGVALVQAAAQPTAAPAPTSETMARTAGG